MEPAYLLAAINVSVLGKQPRVIWEISMEIDM
jgi:hypothetical protein